MLMSMFFLSLHSSAKDVNGSPEVGTNRTSSFRRPSAPSSPECGAEEIRQQLQAKVLELETKTRQIAALIGEKEKVNEQLLAQRTDYEQKLKEVQDKNRTCERTIAQLQQQVAQTTSAANVTELHNQLTQFKSQLGSERDQAKTVQQNLQKEIDQLKKHLGEVQTKEGADQQVAAQLRDAQAENNKKIQELEDCKKQLKTAEQEKDKQAKELEARISRTENSLDLAQQELTNKKKELLEADEEIQSLLSELEEVKKLTVICDAKEVELKKKLLEEVEAVKDLVQKLTSMYQPVPRLDLSSSGSPSRVGSFNNGSPQRRMSVVSLANTEVDELRKKNEALEKMVQEFSVCLDQIAQAEPGSARGWMSARPLQQPSQETTVVTEVAKLKEEITAMQNKLDASERTASSVINELKIKLAATEKDRDSFKVLAQQIDPKVKSKGCC